MLVVGGRACIWTPFVMARLLDLLLLRQLLGLGLDHTNNFTLGDDKL